MKKQEKQTKRDEGRILIFDTTLRDGEQCPGASLNMREKIEIARQLQELGVDVIEAGFPVASEDDFASVRTVAQTLDRTIVAGLARCKDLDIERAAKALEPARRPRIHVFLATSKIHREKKLQMSPDQLVELAVSSVRKARRYVDDVEFSPEDATRTERRVLTRVLDEVVAAGATTLNIPDTVGYTTPNEYADLIEFLRAHVKGAEKVVFSVHCHNDLGLAVANSLSALKSGARQVECTINGLGERAGNAALEEIAMAIRTRSDYFAGLHTGIRHSEIMKTSRLVRHLTGMVVQPNKAIVGDNAFAHESGIHQDGVLKAPETYEIMRPADVGLEVGELVLGKHSGRHAFREKLLKLGYQLDATELDKAFERFKALADRKKKIFDDDLMLIVEEEFSSLPEAWSLDAISVTSSSGGAATATARLKTGNETKMDAACGAGPVDAAYKAIDRITGVHGNLEDYHLDSVTSGKDAQGEVSLRCEFDGVRVTGRGSSIDIIEASAKAYVNALNKYMLLRDKKSRASVPGPKL